MSFSDQLRAIRKERNISQEALAEQLNVSRQAVSKWEQGAGFPEMEKMLLLSKVLDVSLDDLVAGGRCQDRTAGEAGNAGESRTLSEGAAVPAGRIMIKAQNGKAIVCCSKVLSSPRFKTKPGQPRYALFGVDGGAFFGDNTTHLGWYADEEAVKKEMDAILTALKNGEASYELQYAAKVKRSLLSIKLDQ